MSLMEKIKSMFSGGSSDSSDAHAEHDHDHAGHDHSRAAAPMPQTDIAETPAVEERGSTPD